MINKIKSNDISSINMAKSMQQGISFHQKGELQRAEKLYQRVLQNQPQNANAYHLLGIIAYQVGKKKLAIDLMNQAIGIDNKQPIFFSSLGNILQEQKRKVFSSFAGFDHYSTKLRPKTWPESTPKYSPNARHKKTCP